MKKQVCASKVGMFNHLPYEDLEYISNIMIHKEFQKGEMICTPNKPMGLVIIAQGSCKIYQITSDGKEQLIGLAGVGEILGEDSLFSRKDSSNYIEATSDVKACTLPKKEFIELLYQHPSIAIKLLEDYSLKIHQLEKRLTTQSVIKRLCDFLLDHTSDHFTLEMNHKELANYLMTTPETISRRFKQLEKLNLIEKNNKKITILDREELVKIGDMK